MVKILLRCDCNGCLATKQHTVKDHGRDTKCSIHTAISQKIQILLKIVLYKQIRTSYMLVLRFIVNGLACDFGVRMVLVIAF